MKPIFVTAVGALMALSATAAVPQGTHGPASDALFHYLPRAKAMQTATAAAPEAPAARKAPASSFRVETSGALDPHSLAPAALIGYLDGPKGEIWYYTGDYITENGQISGFDFTVYNGAFEVVGKIRDNITLRENETRVAQVAIGPAVTQKFFNYDNNYELMVDIATNTTEYVNNYFTRVYSLTNLEDGALSECKKEIPGYYVAAINTATDAWSENFFLTFLTEEETTTPTVGDVPNPSDLHFVTYKKASYSGELSAVLDVRVPQITTAGSDAIPFLVTQKNGIPYFAVNRLKYCWYENPFDYTNENPTAGNELIIELYSMASSFAQTADLYSTTRLPLSATADDLYFLYLGTFSYNDDIDLTRNDDGTPSYIATVAHSQRGGDEYTYDYIVYDGAPQGQDAAGVRKYDIGTGTSGGFFMNDIPGFAPQVMFIRGADSNVSFEFVNIEDGTVEAAIPYAFNDNSPIYTMNANANRIASADSYMYVVPQTNGFSDDNGDCHTYVVFASPEGDILSVDDINMGQGVDYANVYSGVESYNPYLFNLDSDREYMVLIKRRTAQGDGNQEEFSVISANPEKGVVLSVGPDADKGIITSVSLLNATADAPRLAVIYVNRIPGDWQYTTDYYNLPLTLFDAGDGTAENPYLISTVGGLMQIKSAPAAHFAVVADIDASGVVVSNPDFDFKGSLDGGNHIISNLTLQGRALLPKVSGEYTGGDEDEAPAAAAKGVVANLKFYNARFNATTDAQGLVAGRLSAGKVSNIHVYNSEITSEGDAAGIVGDAVLNSLVSECSFDGTISSPEGSVGGIVYQTSTGASVSACAFTGTITGGSTVGGILASVGSYGGGVVNSHVKADITARNTLGGIVGSAGTVEIAHNHVEGTLTATENLRWGGGAKVGGIAGTYPLTFIQEGQQEPEPVVYIHHNFVNLASITAPEAGEGEYAAQNNTVHRVVGYTRANYAEEVDLDEDWNPIYGDPMPAETAFSDNYVIATLPVVEAAIPDDAASTEGKSIAPDDLSRDFFESTLGFAYGFDAESPWNMMSPETAPALYFETVLLMMKPAEASVKIDQEITLLLTIYGAPIDETLFEDFVCDYNEALLEMTGMAMTETGVSLTLRGIAEGQCDVTAGIKGQTAKAHVTVLPNASGAAEVETAPATALNFDGSTLKAEGAVIEVYSLAGVKVLAGQNAVSTQGLAAGVYIAEAVSAEGRSTLKIYVK